jgi:predicted MFS family arabinose efflux permease
VRKYFSRIVLMLGNVVTGLSILGPAGMLAELANGLHVGIHDTGLLVTYGATVLCIGSPVMAWLTTRIDRRALLVATLAVLAAGQASSALTSNYGVILLLRIGMLAIGAIYTPQAAATVALIAPGHERPSAIAFVFLGWSIAIAGGLPLVTLIATHFGWQAVYGTLAAVTAIVAALLFAALPKGLQGHPLSPQSFVTIAHSKRIALTLLLTLLQTSGQFTVFIYLAPLLHVFTGAGPAIVGAFFAFYGVVGLVGNVVASGIVTTLGTQKTLALFMASMLLGMTLWAVGAGWLLAMGAGISFWALGFAAINSMQQARLIAAAPDLASAFSRAQYLRALCRAGHRIGDRRTTLCARIFSSGRLCRCDLCRACVRAACRDVGACQTASIVISDRCGQAEPSLAKAFALGTMRLPGLKPEGRPYGPHPL